MLIGLMRLLARLPLSWLHAVGGALVGSSICLPVVRCTVAREPAQSGVWRDEADYQRMLHGTLRKPARLASN